jgi:hypothetical protein
LGATSWRHGRIAATDAEVSAMKMLLLLAFLGLGATPRAAEAADVTLVLLNDVSMSMDEHEFAMVKAGYLTAFTDPDVIAAIAGAADGVAVAYVEFSGFHDARVVEGWDVLNNEASTRAFGEAVAKAQRSFSGNTSLIGGLDYAVQLLRASDFGAARVVIDVTSDLPTDEGQAIPVRDAAVAVGITINALPIVDASASPSDEQAMIDFYRRNVIGGPGCFLIEVRDYTAFGAALKRKLLQEIAWHTSLPPVLRLPL